MEWIEIGESLSILPFYIILTFDPCKWFTYYFKIKWNFKNGKKITNIENKQNLTVHRVDNIAKEKKELIQVTFIHGSLVENPSNILKAEKKEVWLGC